MGRRVIQGLMFTLLVTLAMLGVRPGPAAAGSLKMDLSYNCVCHVRCCDDKKNCSADYRPWIQPNGSRTTCDYECTFDKWCPRDKSKADSDVFYQTGCWEDWSEYNGDKKIPNSTFTIGCAANKIPKTSADGAPAMVVFNNLLYDFFESGRNLSFVTSIDGTWWSDPSTLSIKGGYSSTLPIEATGQVAPLADGSRLKVYRLYRELSPPPGTPANCRDRCRRRFRIAETVGTFGISSRMST